MGFLSNTLNALSLLYRVGDDRVERTGEMLERNRKIEHLLWPSR